MPNAEAMYLIRRIIPQNGEDRFVLVEVKCQACREETHTHEPSVFGITFPESVGNKHLCRCIVQRGNVSFLFDIEHPLLDRIIIREDLADDGFPAFQSRIKNLFWNRRFDARRPLDDGRIFVDDANSWKLRLGGIHAVKDQRVDPGKVQYKTALGITANTIHADHSAARSPGRRA